MENTALVPLADTMQLGKVLADSGFFQDSRQAAQAVVKVLAGRELGFGPVASMTGINIISGRVSLSANMIAAAVKRSGRYDYRVVELTDEACRIDFYEKGRDRIGSSSFSRIDAVKAGTKNMDKFPRNMLFARAMSNGAKWYCADIFGGPIYTPEELGANVNEEGEIIEGESRQITTTQPQPVTTTTAQPGNGNGHAPEPPPAFVEGVKDAIGKLFDSIPNAGTERAAAAIKARVVGEKREGETKAHPDIVKTFKKNLAIAIGNSDERHAFTKFMFGSDNPEDWTQGQCMAGNTFLDVGTAGKDENGKANWAPGSTFMRDWPIIKAAIMPPAEVVGK